MAYTSTTELRSRVPIPTATSTASLQALLTATEAIVKKYLGFSPSRAARTTYWNGTGQPLLVLDGGPLQSVTSVYENSAGYGQDANFTSDTLLTLGTDYAVEQEGDSKAAILRRLNSVWPYLREYPVGYLSGFVAPCPGCVKVVATSGLDSDDMAAITEAVYLEAAALYRLWPTGYGLPVSESVAGASASVSPMPAKGPGLLTSPAAENILKFYKRYVTGK